MLLNVCSVSRSKSWIKALTGTGHRALWAAIRDLSLCQHQGVRQSLNAGIRSGANAQARLLQLSFTDPLTSYYALSVRVDRRDAWCQGGCMHMANTAMDSPLPPEPTSSRAVKSLRAAENICSQFLNLDARLHLSELRSHVHVRTVESSFISALVNPQPSELAFPSYNK